MRASLAYDFLAVLRMEANGDLVPHSSGGNEDGSLASEDLGSACLQAIDGGVFAIHIVADLGGSHGRTHRGGGTGDGVAAKINHVRYCCHVSSWDRLDRDAHQ